VKPTKLIRYISRNESENLTEKSSDIFLKFNYIGPLKPEREIERERRMWKGEQ
jgi:hypothetical protein